MALCKVTHELCLFLFLLVNLEQFFYWGKEMENLLVEKQQRTQGMLWSSVCIGPCCGSYPLWLSLHLKKCSTAWTAWWPRILLNEDELTDIITEKQGRKHTNFTSNDRLIHGWSGLQKLYFITHDKVKEGGTRMRSLKLVIFLLLSSAF